MASAAVASAAAVGAQRQSTNTVMVRNIPCKYTQQDIKDRLEELGFADQFDMIYAPRYAAWRPNLGYAFVNFQSASSAEAFHRSCGGQPFGPRSSKACEVIAAEPEGLSKMLATGRRRCRGRAEPLLLGSTALNAARTAKEALAAIDADVAIGNDMDLKDKYADCHQGQLSVYDLAQEEVVVPSTCTPLPGRSCGGGCSGGDGHSSHATTVMLKNIPWQYSQEDIGGILDNLGLHGSYDAIFIPRHLQRKNHLGYAFVNFVQPEFVECFRLLCDGKPFGPAAAESKCCQVVLARIQGSDFSHLDARKGAKTKPKAMPLMVSSKVWPRPGLVVARFSF